MALALLLNHSEDKTMTTSFFHRLLIRFQKWLFDPATTDNDYVFVVPPYIPL